MSKARRLGMSSLGLNIALPISSWPHGCRSFSGASIPDDELLDLATRGQLSEPEELERQVRRLLASPRARTTLAERFFGQWLGLSLIPQRRA